MNRTILAMAGCATLLIGMAFAQDHNELMGAMKTANAANGSLGCIAACFIDALFAFCANLMPSSM